MNTVSRRFGISTLTSLRLFTRAPCTRIRSWLSSVQRRRLARGRVSRRAFFTSAPAISSAFFTSAAIFFSSAAVNSFSANEVGHMAPSSRFASSLKPNVAYLDLNLSALWKKQTILPSLAYAGIPYQVFGREDGCAVLDDRVEPLGHGAIRLHLGDLREQGALASLPVLSPRFRLQLLGALLHRGSFVGRESLGRGGRRGGPRRLLCGLLLSHRSTSLSDGPAVRDRRTAQRSSWMRIRLPAGSRMAQSRTPYGCSVGSWTTSASLACSRSKVPSRSVVARLMLA